mgnify:FL=1
MLIIIYHCKGFYKAVFAPITGFFVPKKARYGGLTNE